MCVFPMVNWSEFRFGQYRDNAYWEDAPNFINYQKTPSFRMLKRWILRKNSCAGFCCHVFICIIWLAHLFGFLAQGKIPTLNFYGFFIHLYNAEFLQAVYLFYAWQPCFQKRANPLILNGWLMMISKVWIESKIKSPNHIFHTAK